MIIAFLIQSAALLSVPLLAPESGILFIICLALVYFSWGEVYVLFASLLADMFGSRNASANYGFLYSSKGVASIVGGGLAAMLFEKTGTWNMVFYGSAILAFSAAMMAIGLRKMSLPCQSQTDALTGANELGESSRA